MGKKRSELSALAVPITLLSYAWAPAVELYHSLPSLSLSSSQFLHMPPYLWKTLVPAVNLTSQLHPGRCHSVWVLSEGPGPLGPDHLHVGIVSSTPLCLPSTPTHTCLVRTPLPVRYDISTPDFPSSSHSFKPFIPTLQPDLSSHQRPEFGAPASSSVYFLVSESLLRPILYFLPSLSIFSCNQGKS